MVRISQMATKKIANTLFEITKSRSKGKFYDNPEDIADIFEALIGAYEHIATTMWHKVEDETPPDHTPLVIAAKHGLDINYAITESAFVTYNPKDGWMQIPDPEDIQFECE